MLVFCQSSGTSNHDCLKIIESGLAMTYASSFITCECIPSESNLLKYSLSCFSSTMGISYCRLFASIFLAPGFPPCFLDLGFLKTGLTSKDWGEESIQYLGLFLFFRNIHIFPTLLFVTCILLEALLAVFDNPSQIQFHLGFGSSHSYMPRQSVCIPPKPCIPHKTCIYVAK